MSTEYHVYVGFMVKVDLSKKVKIAIDTIGCPRCKTETSARYCDKCGDTNQTYTKERETEIDVNDILEDADLLDDYYSPSYDTMSPANAYIICNQDVEYAALFDSGDGGENEAVSIPRMAKDEEVKTLLDVLDKEGLTYTQMEGVYTYWS